MKKHFLLTAILIVFMAGCKSRTRNSDKSTTSARFVSDKAENHTYIRIQAKPDSVAINRSKTAVIVVNMENDFGIKGEMFDRAIQEPLFFDLNKTEHTSIYKLYASLKSTFRSN